MFTGLVEHVGTIESITLCDVGAQLDSGMARADQIGARVRVHAGPLAKGLAKSGSIAVNGCCLTAVDIEGKSFAADLSGETLRRTSLGELKPGAPVNLERPLTASKELGGHFVQGHVDGVGRVAHLEPDGASWWFGVQVPAGPRALHRNERLRRARRDQPHRRRLARRHRRYRHHPLHLRAHEFVFPEIRRPREH